MSDFKSNPEHTDIGNAVAAFLWIVNEELGGDYKSAECLTIFGTRNTNRGHRVYIGNPDYSALRTGNWTLKRSKRIDVLAHIRDGLDAAKCQIEALRIWWDSDDGRDAKAKLRSMVNDEIGALAEENMNAAHNAIGGAPVHLPPTGTEDTPNELTKPKTQQPRIASRPTAPAQEHTDRLARMWFFWGGQNMESDGLRRFMIQLQFDTETDVVEGQECEFRLVRCRIEVACSQALVRHDPDQKFTIERYGANASDGLIAIPDTGGFGAATSAGWSISTLNTDAPMHGKFEAIPFGVIDGPRMQGDSAKLYFRLRDLHVSGAKLPSDSTGERLAEQWLRRCMIPSAVGGRIIVSAQEVSDEI